MPGFFVDAHVGRAVPLRRRASSGDDVFGRGIVEWLGWECQVSCGHVVAEIDPRMTLASTRSWLRLVVHGVRRAPRPSSSAQPRGVVTLRGRGVFKQFVDRPLVAGVRPVLDGDDAAA
jgi:hypothetical protein